MSNYQRGIPNSLIASLSAYSRQRLFGQSSIRPSLAALGVRAVPSLHRVTYAVEKSLERPLYRGNADTSGIRGANGDARGSPIKMPWPGILTLFQ